MTKKDIFSLVLVALITVIFVFVSCDNNKDLSQDSNQDSDQDYDQNKDPSKTVEEKYRFSNIHMYYSSDLNRLVYTKLDENSLTIFITYEVSISYTDVYTQDGGLVHEESSLGREGSWAYLYSGSLKIGYVFITDSGDYIEYGIGKTLCSNRRTLIASDVTPLITEDMQDTHNGIGLVMFY